MSEGEGGGVLARRCRATDDDDADYGKTRRTGRLCEETVKSFRRQVAPPSFCVCVECVGVLRFSVTVCVCGKEGSQETSAFLLPRLSNTPQWLAPPR